MIMVLIAGIAGVMFKISRKTPALQIDTVHWPEIPKCDTKKRRSVTYPVETRRRLHSGISLAEMGNEPHGTEVELFI